MPRKHVASYNWRTDPAYKMKEGHANKMMRPSTHKLLDKLRNMQMLQEPGMVNVVIYDLAHHFLYREKQVVLLGQIAARLTQMWVGLVYNSEDKPAELYGNPEYRPIERPVVGPREAPVRHFLDGKLPEETLAAKRLTNWVRHYEQLLRSGQIGDEVHRAAGVSGEEPGELHLSDIKTLLHFVNTGGYEIPPGKYTISPPQEAQIQQAIADPVGNASDVGDSPFEVLLKEYLKNEGRKTAVESTLEHHVPKVGRPAWSIECTCGKTFAHSEEWTNHVRIRLYRVIMDEFPPIGTVE